MKRFLCLIMVFIIPIYISSCHLLSSYSDENIIDDEVADLAECILDKYGDDIFIHAEYKSVCVSINVISKSDNYEDQLNLIIPIICECNRYLKDNPDYLNGKSFVIDFSKKTDVNGEPGFCYFYANNEYKSEYYNQVTNIIPYIDINDINLSGLDDIMQIIIVDSNVEDVKYAIEALDTIQTVVVDDNDIKDLLKDIYPDVVFIVR